ncbi:MAG TPA: response regulator, partial [Bacillota bacterium]|nr:response regulator [Bacillota bacterium]
MEKIKIFIISGQDELKNMITGALTHVEYILLAGQAVNTAEALAFAETDEADVILVDASVEGDGYRLAESLSARCPETALIILESRLQEEVMRRAIFSGAKDVLIYPFSPAKLIDSIYRSYQSMKKAHQRRAQSSPRQRKKFQQGQL